MLRIGVLGCARIVRRGIAEGIRLSEVARLDAIASRRPGESARWAAELGIERHYDGYEALVADPALDAIYIPLSNELHRPWSLAAASAGKHILCEKPLALDLADAQALVEGCHRAGVVVMEAFMWRHHPRTTAAVEAVRAGRIGDIRLVKMDFSFDIDRGDWRLDPARGGGSIYDLACYGINASRLFTGEEPSEIFARGRLHCPNVEITAGIELRFPSGAIGLLDCSFECPYRNRIEVVGTRGSVELPEGVLPPPEAELRWREPDGTVRSQQFPFAQQYAEEIKVFAASVAAGKLIAPAENGLANMRVIDEARRQVLATQLRC